MARHVKKLKPEKVQNLPSMGTANHFAKVLGLDRTTVTDWIEQKQFPAQKGLGNRWTIVADDFLRWAKRTGRV